MFCQLTTEASRQSASIYMSISSSERKQITHQLRARGNFDNPKLVNPERRACIFHADVYALDLKFKLHKLGRGLIVKRNWHNYWHNNGTYIPVHVRANVWVVSNTNRPVASNTIKPSRSLLASRLEARRHGSAASKASVSKLVEAWKK